MTFLKVFRAASPWYVLRVLKISNIKRNSQNSIQYRAEFQ